MKNLNLNKLISLDRYFDEMIQLHQAKKFPKALLLNGKKGIGKCTLVIHFLNYIFTKDGKNAYNVKEKTLNIDSIFHKQLLNQTNQDVIIFQAKENKNIKIEDIRNLKSLISRSSLSNNPRFIIIDEVEFINENSVNALLKSLEEPSDNNFFILINNQQADLIKTISSRCLKTNIFLNSNQTKEVIDYLKASHNIESIIDIDANLTPGLYIRFNEILSKYKISSDDITIIKINKLLHAYKKNKDKILISLSLFLIDQLFYKLLKKKENNFDFLLNTKSYINKKINDFITYNLNINSVLSSIESKLKNV